MTKNIDVVKAFVAGETKPSTNNLKIDGDKLINYDTVIAQHNGDKLIVNLTKYSPSTTRIQNMVMNTVAFGGYVIEDMEYVQDIPMGSKSLL